MSNTAPSRADPVVVFPLGRWCPPQETSQPHPPPVTTTCSWGLYHSPLSTALPRQMWTSMGPGYAASLTRGADVTAIPSTLLPCLGVTLLPSKRKLYSANREQLLNRYLVYLLQTWRHPVTCPPRWCMWSKVFTCLYLASAPWITWKRSHTTWILCKSMIWIIWSDTFRSYADPSVTC